MGDVFFNNNSTTSNNLHWLNVSMVFGRGTVKEARVVELSSDNPILSSHHPFVGVLKSPALASIQSLRGHTGDAQSFKKNLRREIDTATRIQSKLNSIQSSSTSSSDFVVIGNYVAACLSAKRYGLRQWALQEGPFLPLMQTQTDKPFWERQHTHNNDNTPFTDDLGALFAPFNAIAQYYIVMQGFQWAVAMHKAKLIYCRFAFYQFGLDSQLRPRLYDLASVFDVPSDGTLLFSDANVTCSSDRDCARHMPHRCFSHVHERKQTCQRHTGRCDGVDERGAVLAWCRVLTWFMVRQSRRNRVAGSSNDNDTQTGWVRRTLGKVARVCSADEPSQRWSAERVHATLLAEWRSRASETQWETRERPRATAVYNAQLDAVLRRGAETCASKHQQQFC